MGKKRLSTQKPFKISSFDKCLEVSQEEKSRNSNDMNSFGQHLRIVNSNHFYRLKLDDLKISLKSTLTLSILAIKTKIKERELKKIFNIKKTRKVNTLQQNSDSESCEIIDFSENYVKNLKRLNKKLKNIFKKLKEYQDSYGDD